MSLNRKVPFNTPVALTGVGEDGEPTTGAAFNFLMEVTKATGTIDSQIFLEGKASDTGLDQQGERISLNAIRSLAKQVTDNTQKIPAYPKHRSDWTETLGYIVEARIEENDLILKIELDTTNSLAVRLWGMIQAGRQFGLSVGGFLRQAYYEYNTELKKAVKVLDDFVFDHVAVTTKPVNPRTWLKCISKSFDLEPEEESMEEFVEKMEDDSSILNNNEDELDTIDTVLDEEQYDLSDSLLQLEHNLIQAAYLDLPDEVLLDVTKGFVDALKEKRPEHIDIVKAERVSQLHAIKKIYEALGALEEVVEALDPAAEEGLEGLEAYDELDEDELNEGEEESYYLEGTQEGPLSRAELMAQGASIGSMADFTALIEHSLNNWLSDYGYRVIDIVPAEDAEPTSTDEEEEAARILSHSLPDEHYAHVSVLPDGTKIRHLPFKRKNGKVDKRHLAVALATLNGAMGGVDLDEEGRQVAYKTLSDHYREAFKTEPPALKSLDKSRAVSNVDVKQPLTLREEVDEEEAGIMEEGVEAFDAERAMEDRVTQPPTEKSIKTEPQSSTKRERGPSIIEEEGIPLTSDVRLLRKKQEVPTEKEDKESVIPEMEGNAQDFFRAAVLQMQHLSNVVQQMQEQMGDIQQRLVSTNKSFDGEVYQTSATEFNTSIDHELIVKSLHEKLDEMVTSRLSTVLTEDKTAEALNGRLDTVVETLAKTLDNINQVKDEVESVKQLRTDFDDLKPVLKALEHLPVRKTVVVEPNRTEKRPERVLELPANASEEERRNWVRNELKKVPFHNPNSF